MPRKPDKPAKKPPDLTRLSAKQVATIWRVSAQAVGLWYRAGCPRNDDTTYDLAAVIAWREQRAAGVKTEDDWETEGQKWRAINNKLKALQVEGKLVPLPEVSAFWAERVTVARTSLQSVGQAIAPACVGQDTPTIRDLIDNRIRSICDDLAREFEASLEENERDDGDSTGMAMAPEADPQ